MSAQRDPTTKTAEPVVGEVIGVTDWYEVRQPAVDVFGAVTEDLEPLHNDPEWCKAHSPYGSPIALGFMTLSLLTKWLHEATDRRWSGAQSHSGYPINYGLNKVRFLTPVPVGSRLRGRFVLRSAAQRPGDETLYTFDASVEMDGQERPVLVAEWLLLWVNGTALSAARG
jgi:acyl dehydratase